MKISEHASVCALDENKVRCTVPAEEVARIKGLGGLWDKRTEDKFNVRVITGYGKLTSEKLMAVAEAAKRFGDQCVVISADVKRVDGSFHVFAKGGREDTGMDGIEWIRRCVDNGAGEVVLNSIDTDGVKNGFDLEMLQAVCDVVNVPVIASGGAGGIDHFVELFRAIPNVDAGLAASIFHFGEVEIKDLKEELRKNGINVRL